MKKYRLNTSTDLDCFTHLGNDEELIVAYSKGVLTYPEPYKVGKEFYCDGDINNEILLSAILSSGHPSKMIHYVVSENYFINCFERVD